MTETNEEDIESALNILMLLKKQHEAGLLIINTSIEIYEKERRDLKNE